MTVKELKKVLETIPEEYPVKVWGCSKEFIDGMSGVDFDISDTGVFNGEKLFTIEV